MLLIKVDSLQIGEHALSGSMMLSMPDGEVHLLRGPNGCGKSLLLDVTCGVIKLAGVEVTVAAGRVRTHGAYARWQAGIRRMFQTPTLPPMVRVDEALARVETEGALSSSWDQQVKALFGACGIPDGSMIGALSFGQRRAVDLVYSLASGACHLLDEPFAGMRADAIPFAMVLIRSTAARGTSVLVVDHSAESRPEFFDVCHDWVPAPADVARIPAREDEITIPETTPNPNTTGGDTWWRIDRLAIGPHLVATELEIQLPPGTAIVCEGGNGTGKSTLLRALAGVRHPWLAVQATRQTDLLPQAIMLSPQPPKLIDEVTVAENLGFMLGLFGKYPRSLRDQAHQVLQFLGFDLRRLHRRAEVLSGGEAAMVAFVGAALSPCPILLLDEPFESLSPVAVPRALHLLERVLAVGKAAVIVTHDPATIDAAEPASVLRLSPTRPVTGIIIGAALRPRLPPGRGVVLTQDAPAVSPSQVPKAHRRRMIYLVTRPPSAKL